MVEVKNSCDNCVHKDVCKYTEDFQKSLVDIVKVASDHFKAYEFDSFVDLSIRCQNYVMQPYQEVKSKLNYKSSFKFDYDPLYQADLRRMQETSGNIMKKEEL